MSNRPQPDSFHARTGHELIPEKSKVLSQIGAVSEYAKDNDMKVNLKKTKFMLFNACSSIDFHPKMVLEGTEVELDDQKA